MSITDRSLTLDEFLKRPETKPAREYVEGKVFVKASPKMRHSRLTGAWVEKLNSLATPSRAGMAFPELRCTFGGRSIVPDVAYIRWDRIPQEPSGEVADDFLGAPDIAIEILSPRQGPSRLEENLTHCMQHGTSLGWLFDTKKKTATVFRRGMEPKGLVSGVLDATPVLPGVTFPLEEIFGWLILPR